jgi:hypothetical protein
MIYPNDPRTRLAVKASYLRTAQDALTRATQVEDDNARRSELTRITAAVAQQQALADAEWVDLREAEARVATAALEG